jgi:hypothetical protein
VNNVNGDKRDRQNLFIGFNFANFFNGFSGGMGTTHIKGVSQGIGNIGDIESLAHFIKATEYQFKSRMTQFSIHQQ